MQKRRITATLIAATLALPSSAALLCLFSPAAVAGQVLAQGPGDDNTHWGVNDPDNP